MSVGRVTFLDSLISHVILLYKCLRRGAGLEGGGDKGTGGGGREGRREKNWEGGKNLKIFPCAAPRMGEGDN